MLVRRKSWNEPAGSRPSARGRCQAGGMAGTQQDRPRRRPPEREPGGRRACRDPPGVPSARPECRRGCLASRLPSRSRMTDPEDRDRAGEPVLAVSELTKVYPGRPPTTAVDRLSFALGRREVLGLLGPNGAGKTTTIQMLLSTLRPTSGEISYFGQSLRAARATILAQVGFASAYSRLPRRLTVIENLDVFARLYGLRAGERASRIRELLE